LKTNKLKTKKAALILNYSPLVGVTPQNCVTEQYFRLKLKKEDNGSHSFTRTGYAKEETVFIPTVQL
jgi:hypothetical protein